VTEDERSVRAAEYVLGLASPAERAQVERDLERRAEDLAKQAESSRRASAGPAGSAAPGGDRRCLTG